MGASEVFKSLRYTNFLIIIIMGSSVNSECSAGIAVWWLFRHISRHRTSLRAADTSGWSSEVASNRVDRRWHDGWRLLLNSFAVKLFSTNSPVESGIQTSRSRSPYSACEGGATTGHVHGAQVGYPILPAPYGWGYLDHIGLPNAET